METGSGNAEQPDVEGWLADQAGVHETKPPLPSFSPELLAEFLAYAERMRDWMNTPPTPNEGDAPLSRLNMENPPNAPQEPLLRCGYALLAMLPAEWERVILMATAAAEEVRTYARVLTDAGELPDSEVYFFTDLIEPLSSLRRSMYDSGGQGAWYNASIHLYRDGTIHPTYDYVSPPFAFWGVREVELVRRDQELFPRDPEQLPIWHPAR